MQQIFKIHHIFFLILILLAFIILRFYDLEHRLVFAVDQIQNAWVMKNLIVDGKLPLHGMAVRQDSGLFIGPGYYYLLAPFYFLYDLDPIGGGVFAGAVSIMTFVVLYLVTKRIFSPETALISVFFYTISYQFINADRVAWPVILLPIVSILIFYFLYQIMLGKTYYLMLLATVVGFSFHVHFTAIFFPIIIFLIAPFALHHKDLKRYIIPSFFLLIIWFLPSFIAGYKSQLTNAFNFIQYFQNSFNGIHLRRLIQLFPESLIEFQGVFGLLQIHFLIYLIFILYLFVQLWRQKTKRFLIWLITIWFMVPWVILALYKGEISDYFFTITRPVALMIVGYGIFQLIMHYRLIANLVLVFLLILAYVNIRQFAAMGNTDFPLHRLEAIRAIKEQRKIEFAEFNAESYLFYMYDKRKHAVQ